MDVTLGEQQSDKENTMSSSAENGSVSDEVTVESTPSYDSGDWFELGRDHNLLQANCLAMSREFHREPKNVGSKSRSLAEKVEAAWFHASSWTTWLPMRSPF